MVVSQNTKNKVLNAVRILHQKGLLYKLTFQLQHSFNSVESLVGSSLDLKKTQTKTTQQSKKKRNNSKTSETSASDNNCETSTFIKHESPFQQESLHETKIDEFIVAK